MTRQASSGSPSTADASADDPERLDAGHVEPVEVAQHLVLAHGDVGLDLLDRQDPPRQLDEPHDVPRDAPREGGQDVLGPGLQRELPGQVEQGRVGSCRGDLEGHVLMLPDRGSAGGPCQRPLRHGATTGAGTGIPGA